MVTPSLPPGDRHKEFAVVAGAGPTLLRRLKPPKPVLLDRVGHPARWPHLLSLEGFQRCCSCREQETYPAPASWPPILSRCWLASVVCKREARPVATRLDDHHPRIAGVVSTRCPTLPQSVPGAETACSWRLVSRVTCAPGAATTTGRAWALRPGTVLHSVVDQCTLWLCALRLACRCFPPPRPPRPAGVDTYDPSFALMPWWARSAAASQAWRSQTFPMWNLHLPRCSWTACWARAAS
nr:uncharacterized protein LOC129528508 [Gorilla gorilla gorilla]